MKIRKAVYRVGIYASYVLLLAGGYLFVQQASFYFFGTPGSGAVLEVTERRVKIGSLPGVTGRSAAREGRLGGSRESMFEDLSVVYDDPELGQVTGKVVDNSSKYRKGDILEVKFYAGDPTSLQLKEQENYWLMMYGVIFGAGIALFGGLRNSH